MARITLLALLAAMCFSCSAVGAQDQTITLTPLGAFDAADSIVWAGNSQLAALQDGQLELWNVNNADFPGVYHSITLPVPALAQNVGAVALSPDEATLAVAAMQETRQPVGQREQGVIFRWDAQTGALIAPWPTAEMNIYGNPLALVYSPAGDVLVFGFSLDSASCQRFGSYVVLFDAQTGEQLVTHTLQRNPPYALAFSPDGARLAIYQMVDSCVPMLGRITVLADDVEVASLEFPRVTGATALAFSPDGTRLVASAQPEWNGLHSTLHVWDTATFSDYQTYELEGSQITTLAFYANSIVLIGDETGYLHVFDLAAGIMKQTIRLHTTGINDLALSADRSLLATAGDDDGFIWRIVAR